MPLDGITKSLITYDWIVSTFKSKHAGLIKSFATASLPRMCSDSSLIAAFTLVICCIPSITTNTIRGRTTRREYLNTFLVIRQSSHLLSCTTSVAGYLHWSVEVLLSSPDENHLFFICWIVPVACSFSSDLLMASKSLCSSLRTAIP